MHRRSAVLYSDPTDLAFIDRVQDALDDILEKHGYYFVRTGFEKATDDLMRHVHVEQRHSITLSLAVDLRLQLRYIEVESAHAEETDRAFEWLCQRLPVAPLSELQETARSVMQDDPDALVRLAIGAGNQADPESLTLVRAGLRDQSDIVRFRAAEAAALTRWPELRSDVEALIEDPSPEVRKIAAHAIDACAPGES